MREKNVKSKADASPNELKEMEGKKKSHKSLQAIAIKLKSLTNCSTYHSQFSVLC